MVLPDSDRYTGSELVTNKVFIQKFNDNHGSRLHSTKTSSNDFDTKKVKLQRSNTFSNMVNKIKLRRSNTFLDSSN